LGLPCWYCGGIGAGLLGTGLPGTFLGAGVSCLVGLTVLPVLAPTVEVPVEPPILGPAVAAAPAKVPLILGALSSFKKLAPASVKYFI